MTASMLLVLALSAGPDPAEDEKARATVEVAIAIAKAKEGGTQQKAPVVAATSSQYWVTERVVIDGRWRDVQVLREVRKEVRPERAPPFSPAGTGPGTTAQTVGGPSTKSAAVGGGSSTSIPAQTRTVATPTAYIPLGGTTTDGCSTAG